MNWYFDNIVHVFDVKIDFSYVLDKSAGYI